MRLLGRQRGAYLGNTGKTLSKDLRGQVGQLEVNVVLLRADATPLANLNRGGARDDVTGGKILSRGSISGDEMEDTTKEG